MKLELKHIASHLPYNLQFKIFGQIRLYNWGANVENVMSLIDYGKPILHPLSDLIKEIEINGEWFVPAELLCQIGIALGYIKDNAPTIPIDYRIIQKPFGKVLKVQKLDDWLIYFSFDEPNRAKKWIIDKLYEWHYDVDNLIENGLAIDINTLEE